MTEVEIKKLAGEYIDNCTKRAGFVILAENIKDDFINLFVAGFMKCLELNEIKWHKVADKDLPKENSLVLSDKGMIVIWRGFSWAEYSPNYDNIKLNKWEEPIAWCEIPRFEVVNK